MLFGGDKNLCAGQSGSRNRVSVKASPSNNSLIGEHTGKFAVLCSLIGLAVFLVAELHPLGWSGTANEVLVKNWWSVVILGKVFLRQNFWLPLKILFQRQGL